MRYIGIISNTDLSGPQEISLYCISRQPLRMLFKEKKFPLSFKGSFVLLSLLDCSSASSRVGEIPLKTP